jgi:hypothetical protein
MPVSHRKDIPYVKQTNIEQNNKGIKQQLYSETSKQRQFLICQLCFWCASYYAHSTANVSVKFDIDNIETAQCPSCNTKGRIEFLPISYNQSYVYGEHI